MPNPITPAGHARLLDDYHALFGVERPKIVEMVSWAAGNGDRSENGDYIYGRKRLREIDGALNRLSRTLKNAVIVDPAAQPDKARAFFGATVGYLGEDDVERQVTLVGVDESDADTGRIGWTSPMALALRGAAVGDVRAVQLPGGPQEIEILSISYPA